MWRWLLLVDPQVFWAQGPVVGPGPCGPSGALHAGSGGGFAALEASCRRVVVLMTPFPPSGGGEAVTRGGVFAKVQTHWAKDAENQSF